MIPFIEVEMAFDKMQILPNFMQFKKFLILKNSQS